MKRLMMAFVLLPLMALADTEMIDGVEWTYTVSDGEATIGSGEYYTPAIPANTLGAITIPLTLGGCPVTRIGADAFWNCRGLTSVVIPSSVTSIGASAIYGCVGLATVEIPSGVTSIGNSAFYNCTGLTALKIPSAVTSIGSSAFFGCKGVKTVTIPSGVTSIEYSTSCLPC